MVEIKDKEFGGERPLFAQHDLKLINVTIHAGESAFKRCDNILAEKCTFEGKYPFWHSSNFTIKECIFRTGARAALWYSQGCVMRSCMVEAPKMFRKIQDVNVEDTNFIDGQEMFWDCDRVRLSNVSIDNCDYIFSHTNNIDICDYRQNGNYSFQYGKNARIKNAIIHSKDAFWNTENFTIVDSELHGEYLGWYSHGLTLINCKISGTQPLCYAQGLTLINCEFDADCDLAFEESEVNAEIITPITSVKNPRHGRISAKSIGKIIIDSHVIDDSDCKIVTTC